MKWKEMKDRLPRLAWSDQNQKKRFHHMVRFFLVMLALTIFSRGVSAVIVPTIVLEKTRSKKLGEMFEGRGEVVLANEMAILVYEGLEIATSFVEVGEKIDINQPLFAYNKEEVDKELARLSAEVAKEKLVREKLSVISEADYTPVENAKQELYWVKEDSDNTRKEGRQRIDECEDEVATAKLYLDSLEHADPPTPLADIIQAQIQLDNARNRLDTTIISVEEKATAQGRQITRGKQQLDSAENQYEQAKLTEQSTQKGNNLENNLQSIAIEEKDENIAYLQGVKEKDYQHLSTQEGVLRQWDIIEGEQTRNKCGIISDATQGYQFVFEIGEEYRKHINYGDEIEITQDGREQKGEIQSIKKSISGQGYEIITKLVGDKFYESSAKIEMVFSQEEYRTCVPISAVYQDNQSSFVFIMEEKHTILGLENIAQRVDVQVVTAMDGYCAVNMAIGEEVPIIVTSSKPLSHGDRIKVG